MRVSKTALWAFLVAVIGISWLYLRPSSHEDAPLPPDSAGPLGAQDQAIYDLKVELLQTKTGEAPSLALLIEGDLGQTLQGDGSYLSQWRVVRSFSLMGQDSSHLGQALAKNPLLSVFQPQPPRFEHLAVKETPELLQKIQANILDKILLPIPPGTKPLLNEQRSEKDDLGLASILYASQAEGTSLRIARTWESYENPSISIDPGERTLRYLLGSEGRLIQLSGKVSVEMGGIRYTTSIQLELKGRAQAAALITRAGRADMKAVDGAAATPTTAGGKTLEESLSQLDELTDKSPGTQLYQIFSQIKQDLIAYPEHGEAVAQRILGTAERDASSKRRMSVLFGALAQSESSHHSDLLADLARQCGDAFCRVQALVGISDHKHPSESAARTVMDLAREKGDGEVQATALLAAGSVGKKLPSGLPELSTLLSSDLKDPAMAKMKTTVLAAMGNHGKAEYLPELKSYIAAKDLRQRASAVYSLRYIAEAKPLLLDVLQSNQEKVVMNEVYKALEYHTLEPSEYQSFAQRSLQVKDQDLQLAAARNLVRAYERTPSALQATLDDYKAKTDFPNVRSYIDEQTKASAAP